LGFIIPERIELNFFFFFLIVFLAFWGGATAFVGAVLSRRREPVLSAGTDRVDVGKGLFLLALLLLLLVEASAILDGVVVSEEAAVGGGVDTAAPASVAFGVALQRAGFFGVLVFDSEGRGAALGGGAADAPCWCSAESMVWSGCCLLDCRKINR